MVLEMGDEKTTHTFGDRSTQREDRWILLGSRGLDLTSNLTLVIKTKCLIFIFTLSGNVYVLFHLSIIVTIFSTHGLKVTETWPPFYECDQWVS